MQYANVLPFSVPYTPYFAHTGGYAALAAESPQQCMAVAYEDLKELSPGQIIHPQPFWSYNFEPVPFPSFFRGTEIPIVKIA